MHFSRVFYVVHLLNDIMFELHFFFFFQAEDGIRDAQESRGLGDVYKRQIVTRLVIAARRLYSHGPLQPEAFQARQKDLMALVTEITPADLGLQKMQVPIQPSFGFEPAPVLYQHIYDDDSLSLGIFLLPHQATLPLHDHPDMTVVSRLVFGDLHSTGYTFCNEPEPSGGLAWRHHDERVTAPHVAVAEPVEGNLHELTCTSENGAAMLDILTPPYEDDQRPCTYFQVKPTDDDQVVRLLPTLPSADFNVCHSVYEGYALSLIHI
eukprot:TRINITY_DN26103_c0_g1_i2.p1 TRINITY_DN26103_c0_g1~~TRINITY_DN26103_c0_g1_i2.p1  ORF type:complete len:265 (-),score=66.11 TRINITY_DN26103_c0_g1_i2:110-904(-)